MVHAANHRGVLFPTAFVFNSLSSESENEKHMLNAEAEEKCLTRCCELRRVVITFSADYVPYFPDYRSHIFS